MISSREREFLRDLAKQYEEQCYTEKNKIKRQKWYDINDLKEGATPVFINHYWPLALSEVLPKNTYVCEDPKAVLFEQYLRTKLFYTNQLDDDNVCEPVIPVQMTYNLEKLSQTELDCKK